MKLLDRLFPYPSSGAGVPGLAHRAPRHMTDDEKAASAAKFLADYAARKRAAAAMQLIRDKCAELRRGPVSPIRPRDIVVAGARREHRHA